MIRLRENVEIVPLALEHAANMTRWMQDSQVSRNVGLRRAATFEQTVAWIENAANDDSICPFAILVDKAHVGNAILDKHDEYLATARFSIYIGESAERSAGAGKTAAFLICKHGFENLNLHKIWLTVHARNFNAINAYARIGFALEGILRAEFLLDGERLDALYMGMLKTDFERVEKMVNGKC